MAIEKIYLDPNAQSYANLAALDPSADSALVAASALAASALQTGEEARDVIVALADLDRQIIITRPAVGQKKIIAIQTHSDGKQEIEQNDTTES